MKKLITVLTGLLITSSIFAQGTQLHSGVPIYHFSSGLIKIGDQDLAPLAINRNGNGTHTLFQRSGITKGYVGLSNNGTSFFLTSYADLALRVNGSGNDAFYLKNNGNIGIGTNSPAHKLQVQSDNHNYIRSKSSGTNSIAGFSLNNDAKEWVVRTNSDDYFQIKDVNNNVQRLVIKPTNGNVGIGNNSPVHKLHVTGNLGVEGISKFYSTQSGNTDKRLTLNTADGDNTYLYNYDESDATFHTINLGGTHSLSSGLTVLGNGNVGIGHTNPVNFRLWVSAKNNGEADFRVGSINNTPEAFVRMSNGTNWGLLLRSDVNAPKVGAYTGGSLHIQPYSDFNGALDDTKGPLATYDFANMKVGIGTSSPTEKLSVEGQDVSFYSQTTSNNLLFGRNDQENLKVRVTDTSMYMDYNQDSDNNAAHVLFFRNLAQGNSPDNDIRFETGGSKRLTIKANGNVGIGTTSPSETLEVNGNALIQGDFESKKVTVTQTPGNWPDYVFEAGYQLPSLEETEVFIKVNKHLPEVPSAKEVGENGQDLGDIQAILLKKMEEMTLHMIEMNKKIEQLEKENNELKKEVRKKR